MTGSAGSDSGAAQGSRAGAFSALRQRDFRVLWTGTVASYIGFFMSTITQSVVAFDLSGTNRAVGTVVFAQGLAMAVLTPMGGAFADRLPKRLIVGSAQLASVAAFASLALMLATQTLTLAWLAAFVLVLGGGLSFLGPARQALSAELVPDRVRGNAIALNQVALTGSQVLGPAFAGMLLASSAGAAGAYASMAALYGFAAVMLWFVPSVPARSGAGDTHVFADLAAGAGYVRSHPRLRVLVLFFISVIMVGFPYVTVMPGLVENAFGRDADAISVLFLASAVGGLGASLVAARVADTRLAQPLFVVLAALFGVGLLLLSAVPSYEAAVAVSVVAGAGMGGFQSLNGAVIVRTSEPVYFGRVFSLTMLAFAGFGLMGLPVGWMADAVGERGVLRAMGVAVVLLAAAAGVWLARVLRAER